MNLINYVTCCWDLCCPEYVQESIRLRPPQGNGEGAQPVPSVSIPISESAAQDQTGNSPEFNVLRGQSAMHQTLVLQDKMRRHEVDKDNNS